MQIPGILDLMTKFLPTAMNLLRKLAEAGQKPPASNPIRQPPLEGRSNRDRASTNSTTDSTPWGITSSESGSECSNSSLSKAKGGWRHSIGHVLFIAIHFWAPLSSVLSGWHRWWYGESCAFKLDLFKENFCVLYRRRIAGRDVRGFVWEGVIVLVYYRHDVLCIILYLLQYLVQFL